MTRATQTQRVKPSRHLLYIEKYLESRYPRSATWRQRRDRLLKASAQVLGSVLSVSTITTIVRDIIEVIHTHPRSVWDAIKSFGMFFPAVLSDPIYLSLFISLFVIVVGVLLFAYIDQRIDAKFVREYDAQHANDAELRVRENQRAARSALTHEQLMQRLRDYGIDTNYIPDTPLSISPNDARLLLPASTSASMPKDFREIVDWLQQRLRPKSNRAQVALYGRTGSGKSMITRLLLDRISQHTKADDLQTDYYDGIILVECADADPASIFYEIGKRYIPGKIEKIGMYEGEGKKQEVERNLEAIVPSIITALKGARALIILDHLTLGQSSLYTVIDTLRATGVAVLALADERDEQRDGLTFPAGTYRIVPPVYSDDATQPLIPPHTSMIASEQQRWKSTLNKLGNNRLAVRLASKLAKQEAIQKGVALPEFVDLPEFVEQNISASSQQAPSLNDVTQKLLDMLLAPQKPILSPAARSLFVALGANTTPYCSAEYIREVGNYEANEEIANAIKELIQAGLLIDGKVIFWLPVVAHQRAQTMFKAENRATRKTIRKKIRAYFMKFAPVIFANQSQWHADVRNYLAFIDWSYGAGQKRIMLELCNAAYDAWRDGNWYYLLMHYNGLALEVVEAQWNSRNPLSKWRFRHNKTNEEANSEFYYHLLYYFAEALLFNVDSIVDDLPLVVKTFDQIEKIFGFPSSNPRVQDPRPRWRHPFLAFIRAVRKLFPKKLGQVYAVNIIGNRATIERMRGDIDQSNTLYERARKRYADPHIADDNALNDQAAALISLTFNALIQYNFELAHKHADDAVLVYPENGMSDGYYALALQNLAYADFVLGNYNAASEGWKKAEKALNKADIFGQIQCIQNYSQMDIVQGKADVSVKVYQDFLKAHPNLDARVTGQIKAALAAVRLVQGRLENAHTLLDEARLLFRRKLDRSNEARVLLQLAHVMFKLGRSYHAQRYAVGALERFTEANDMNNVVVALVQLGNIAFNQGHIEQAISLYQQTKVLLQTVVDAVFTLADSASEGQKSPSKRKGNPRLKAPDLSLIDAAIQAHINEVPILMGLGQIAQQHGDLHLARNLYAEAYEITATSSSSRSSDANEVHENATPGLNPSGEAEALVALAEIDLLQYRHDAAEKLNRARGNWDTIHDEVQLATTIPYCQAKLALATGNVAEADRLLREAYAIAAGQTPLPERADGRETMTQQDSKQPIFIYYPEIVVDCQTEMIEIALLRGQYADAQRIINDQAALLQPYGLRRAAATNALHCGLAHLGLRDFEKAEEHFEKAFVLAREMQNRLCETRLYVEHGKLLLLQGKSFHLQGDVLQAQDRWNQAFTSLKEGEELAQRYGDTRQLAWALIWQGEIALARGDRNTAMQCLQEGVKYASHINDTVAREYANGVLATIWPH